MKTVLFVCTGNTCRSPMAEAIARHHLESGLLGEDAGVFVASAGIMAADGLPISPGTIKALADLGIEHEGRSKLLTAEMVHKADIVFCLTAVHRDMVIALTADEDEAASAVLLDPRGDVPDPIGLPQAAYDQLAARLSELVPAQLKEMLCGEDRSRIGSSG